MKLKNLIALVLLTVGVMAARADALSIVPLPQEIQVSDNQFTFEKNCKVGVPEYKNDSVLKVFESFRAKLEKAGGTNFVVGKKDKGSLVLKLNGSIGAEGYNLDVTKKGIVVEASTPAGFFYGLQTLLQMLPIESDGSPATLQCVEIKDQPRFGWRGFMLDEGRHIFGKDEVKRVLDMMATYKMNRFHWHLTEDQGWRIEIKKYPELTGKGAFRSSTKLGWRDVIYPDSIPYGGYYTQDDIREIIQYAKDRFIEVVPEIDIPGHSQAAVAAYPEILACDPENPHEVWLMQGVSTDVMNVANPKAVQMVKDIFDEVVELFPYGFIHVGGDECPTKKWKENEQCKERLAELGSENYRDLQLDLYRQLAEHLASKPEDRQKRLIFWNEVLGGNVSMLPENIVIMSWLHPYVEQEAARAVAHGFDAILTPQIPYYINRKQASGENEPMSQGSGTETLESVYAYSPAAGVDPKDLPSYMGVQANFWSEYVETPEVLEYLMLPRLTAVAEAAWTPQERRNYNDYLKRMDNQVKIFESNGWNYCPHEVGK